jgi:hypothetical protein
MEWMCSGALSMKSSTSDEAEILQAIHGRIKPAMLLANHVNAIIMMTSLVIVK